MWPGKCSGTGCTSAAADRRSDDQRQAHGREDRPLLRAHGDARAGRVALGGRGRKIDQRGRQTDFRSREPATPGTIGRVLPTAAGGAAGALRRGVRQAVCIRLVDDRDSAARLLGDAGAGGFLADGSCGNTSTGRHSSLPGSSKGSIPKIFEDATIGTEARRLFDDAQALLGPDLQREAAASARGVYGFWPAANVGDDIVVYTDESAHDRTLPVLWPAATVGAQRAEASA